MPRLAPRRGVIAKALLGGAAAGLVGGVAALGTALGSLSVAWTALQAAGAQLAPRAPESVWPTSATGWLSLVLAAVAVWGVWRKREEGNVAPVKKEIIDAVALFRGEITRVERHVDGALGAVQRQITNDINGWSRRIEVVERRQEADAEFDESVVRFMGQSETDRANLGRLIETLARTVADMRRETNEQMNNILKALVELRGGRRQ